MSYKNNVFHKRRSFSLRRKRLGDATKKNLTRRRRSIRRRGNIFADKYMVACNSSENNTNDKKSMRHRHRIRRGGNNLFAGKFMVACTSSKNEYSTKTILCSFDQNMVSVEQLHKTFTKNIQYYDLQDDNLLTYFAKAEDDTPITDTLSLNENNITKIKCIRSKIEQNQLILFKIVAYVDEYHKLRSTSHTNRTTDNTVKYMFHFKRRAIEQVCTAVCNTKKYTNKGYFISTQGIEPDMIPHIKNYNQTQFDVKVLLKDLPMTDNMAHVYDISSLEERIKLFIKHTPLNDNAKIFTKFTQSYPFKNLSQDEFREYIHMIFQEEEQTRDIAYAEITRIVPYCTSPISDNKEALRLHNFIHNWIQLGSTLKKRRPRITVRQIKIDAFIDEKFIPHDCRVVPRETKKIIIYTFYFSNRTELQITLKENEWGIFITHANGVTINDEMRAAIEHYDPLITPYSETVIYIDSVTNDNYRREIRKRVRDCAEAVNENDAAAQPHIYIPDGSSYAEIVKPCLSTASDKSINKTAAIRLYVKDLKKETVDTIINYTFEFSDGTTTCTITSNNKQIICKDTITVAMKKAILIYDTHSHCHVIFKPTNEELMSIQNFVYNLKEEESAPIPTPTLTDNRSRSASAPSSFSLQRTASTPTPAPNMTRWISGTEIDTLVKLKVGISDEDLTSLNICVRIKIDYGYELRQLITIESSHAVFVIHVDGDSLDTQIDGMQVRTHPWSNFEPIPHDDKNPHNFNFPIQPITAQELILMIIAERGEHCKLHNRLK